MRYVEEETKRLTQYILGVFNLHTRPQESLQANDEVAVPQPATHVVGTAETLKGTQRYEYNSRFSIKLIKL